MNISFTSDYKAKLKIKNPNKELTKKQLKKEQNYNDFRRCCETLAYSTHGILFSEEEFSSDKIRKGTITLYVPDEADDIIESFLLYNNIKFKKLKNK